MTDKIGHIILLLVFCQILFQITLAYNDQMMSGTREVMQEEKRNRASKRRFSNYKEIVFKYPPGVISERDIPICPEWKDEALVIPTSDILFRDEQSSNRKSEFLSSDSSIQTSSASVENIEHSASTDSAQQPLNRMWACNVIHKRYFFPPVVERICRCPSGDECHWEWSDPPKYRNHKYSRNKIKRDPFTIMIGTRTQVKFCNRIANILPKCKKKLAVQTTRAKKPETSKEIIPPYTTADMVHQELNDSSAQFSSIGMNCYCPALNRHWRFLQSSVYNFKNGTSISRFEYDCEKLPKCKADDHCGNVRNDLHSVYFHCSCPTAYLCLPRKYPTDEHFNEDGIKAQESLYYATIIKICYEVIAPSVMLIAAIFSKFMSSFNKVPETEPIPDVGLDKELYSGILFEYQS